MKRILISLMMSAGAVESAGPPGFNYDEAAVPRYELPDPLRTEGGEVVKDAEMWRAVRRPELLALIEREMFGKAPARPALWSKALETPAEALGGKAVRHRVFVSFTGKAEGPGMELLVYLPAGAKGPVPVVLGLNFRGNHTVTDDPAVPVTASWVPNDAKAGIKDHRATEAGRGSEAGRWQVPYAVGRGYGVATVYYGDIDPDEDDGWKNGVHALHGGVEGRDGASWGSIAAWTWGLRLGLDALEQMPGVDGKRVICQGHSRLGKTALWAGAVDERFAMVISNDSGAGGAALNKRIFGETVGRLNTSFPHWFCGNFRKYSENEGAMPFDAHSLIALTAPRPLLITSATEDLWADPKGEFLGGLHASPVWRLLGEEGLGVSEMPEPMRLVGGRVGYFLRTGPHDVTQEDWKAYLDFADRVLKP